MYHELSEKEAILTDIHGALRSAGELVVLERMAKRKGDKHGDCGHPKLWEEDFINEMKSLGFRLTGRVMPNKRLSLVYFTFEKNSAQ